MKNTLTIDFVSEKIVMDRTFAQKAKNTHTDEYAHLQQVRLDYPKYEVVIKTIKKNPKKETYKGLTYQYMFDHITTHGNKEDLKELEEMIWISKCHREGHRYPTVKSWFFEKYPDVKTFWVAKKESPETEESTTIPPRIFIAGINKNEAA